MHLQCFVHFSPFSQQQQYLFLQLLLLQLQPLGPANNRGGSTAESLLVGGITHDEPDEPS